MPPKTVQEPLPGQGRINFRQEKISNDRIENDQETSVREKDSEDWQTDISLLVTKMVGEMTLGAQLVTTERDTAINQEKKQNENNVRKGGTRILNFEDLKQKVPVKRSTKRKICKRQFCKTMAVDCNLS